MEIRYFVYWLRDKTHTDIFTEGYVGVSYNPAHRLTQHKRWAKTSPLKYKTQMTSALVSGEFVFSVVLESTPEYCRDIERKLRPSIGVGWNKAIGADGGTTLKHGLSSTAIKRAYHNLKTACTKKGKVFEPNWPTVKEFESFYLSLEGESGKLTLLDPTGDYTADNIGRIPFLEICRRRERIFEYQGVLYSQTELAEKLGIKRNTLTCRLRRGWSVEEVIHGRN